MRELEAALAGGRFTYAKDNPVLPWCFSNVLVKETMGGIFATKGKNPELKIDGAVGCIFVIGRSEVLYGIDRPNQESVLTATI